MLLINCREPQWMSLAYVVGTLVNKLIATTKGKTSIQTIEAYQARIRNCLHRALMSGHFDEGLRLIDKRSPQFVCIQGRQLPYGYSNQMENDIFVFHNLIPDFYLQYGLLL